MIRELDGRTFVSGQIQPGDMAQIKQAGVAMIVCNRPDGEDEDQPRAADIERAAKEAGLEFRHVPIRRGIGPSDVEAMQEAMAAADGKLLAYCRSGNRSTLAWAVARSAEGADLDELEAAAKRAGFDLAPVSHLL